MTDPLDSVQNRLRWINRGILAAAVLVVVGLSMLVIRTVHGPKTNTLVEHVGLPVPAASRASVVAKAASAPRPPNMAASNASAHPMSSAPASMPSQAVSAASTPLMAAAAHPDEEDRSTPLTQTVQPDMAPRKSPSAAASTGPAPTIAPSHPTNVRQQSESREHTATVLKKAQRLHKAKSHPSGLCEQVGWYVQVGAFAHKSSFESLQSRLARGGFESCKAPRAPQHLSLLFVGAYATREEARRAQMQLKKLLGGSSYLRHLPAVRN